jgi:hypothetical protein
MQIHELTQLKEASIADRIKSVGTAVKTGVQNMQDRQAASNVAAGQAQQDKTQAQAAKYAEILKSRGYTGQTAAATAAAGTVQPGQRIKIVATQPNGTQSNYYKTDKGWENELGQPVTNPTSVAYLEKLYATQVRPAAGSATTGQAGAVMTAVDVDQAIRQLGLSQQQLKAFQSQATQNPGFVQAFLKRLGLVR